MPPKIQQPTIQDPEYPEVPFTQPTNPPSHPHAPYEYNYGNMHRCHLCGAMEDHLNNQADQVWFTTLEDRCRHIIECHRDFPLEVSRAEEILGITQLWDRKSAEQVVRERNPYDANARQGMPVRQQQTSSQQTGKQQSWFRRHPKLTIVLLLLGAYGAYCLYLVWFQGYTF